MLALGDKPALSNTGHKNNLLNSNIGKGINL